MNREFHERHTCVLHVMLASLCRGSASDPRPHWHEPSDGRGLRPGDAVQSGKKDKRNPLTFFPFEDSLLRWARLFYSCGRRVGSGPTHCSSGCGRMRILFPPPFHRCCSPRPPLFCPVHGDDRHKGQLRRPHAHATARDDLPAAVGATHAWRALLWGCGCVCQRV